MDHTNELTGMIDSVHNDQLHELLENFFHDKVFMDKFKKTPASKMYHGNHEGGLLEHTLGVVELCNAICDVSSVVGAKHVAGDRNLLITGALLHDIGKIHCYEKAKGDGPFQGYLTTHEGRMFGHIALGVVAIHDFMKKVDFPASLGTNLEHMVLSHHGPVENGWGSAVDPITPEAISLHYADLMESRVAGGVQRG